MQPNELRITGDSLVCNGGTVQLTVTTLALGAPVGYRWSTGATTASISVTQPGLYSVTAIFKDGYSLTEQFRVRGLTPSLQITGNTGALCPGTPRQLTAVGSGALALRWSTGATTPSITVTQPGTYSVQATYSAACTLSTQVEVQANKLSIRGRQQLCPGQSTTLTATAEGSTVAGYRWSTGATTPTLVVAQAGTYTATATFADGCTQTATHTVGPPVAKVASINGDTLLCAGATLSLTALNPDASSYQWNTGATTPTITADRPGTYAVVLSYPGGCTSRDSLLVQPVPGAPVFTLGPDTTLCLEQPLLLRAPAFSGPGVFRRWSDGSTGPTLLVSTAGTYSLQINTLCGSRTESRRVDYASCLSIPNVITPNNDQLNDRFVVRNLTRGDWALTLYNRWGKQVYATGIYRHDWGADAAPGVYYYVLRQGAIRYTGHLEVIR
nr:gliding motility-associated C-terminal domain-containing protein [Hymenobacter lucidus]